MAEEDNLQVALKRCDTERPLIIDNFINGQFLAALNGTAAGKEPYIPSYNPATQEIWANVPNSDVADVNKAVLAAKHAFKRLAYFFVTCTKCFRVY